MWIGRKEFEWLKKRVAELEEGKAPKHVTVHGWSGKYFTSDDHVSAEVGEAIRLLAEHCGMEFERTPRVNEKVVLKKKDKAVR